MEIKHILVVRFRQMGDAVLATPLLNALRRAYPHAEIDFVLNVRIAPLFEGHQSVSRIITFTDEERHHSLTYLKKIWRIVHDTRYDVMIDLRSTLNTMPFALFSLTTPFRIGTRKWYTRMAYNARFDGCKTTESMVAHNLSLLTALGIHDNDQTLTLNISEKEKTDFRNYMHRCGIDFSRPVMLAGVTAKLPEKTWAEDRMTEILRRFINAYPQVQIIFNFAPGREAENARRIFDNLGKHKNIFIGIEAKSMRQLAALAANCTFYFGNEGGGRHIVQAMGRPSLVVCSPMASKKTWLPENQEVLTCGIAATDIDPAATTLSYEAQYALIGVESVWAMLQPFYSQINRQKK